MARDFKFTTNVFGNDNTIPEEYTCEGESISPPLKWSSPPDGIQSLVLIADDPDAPTKTFAHWLLFNLPPDTTSLPRDVDVEERFAAAEMTPVQGVNDFGDIGYGAPCPPAGDGPHHYSFRLYALDTTLDLGEGVTRRQLADAMDGHALSEANLIGTFERA